MPDARRSVTGSAGAPRSLWRQSLVSVVDQSWLSMLNLIIGLLLIRLTTPEDYGVYTLLFAGGVFAVIVAEALLINPLTTLAAAKAPAQRDAMIARVNRLHRRLSGALAALLGGVSAIVLWQAEAEHAASLAVLFAAYIYLSARREFQRSEGFLQHDPGRVLRTDIEYGLALALAVAVIAAWDGVTLMGVMLALVLANLWVLWRGRHTARNAPAPGIESGELGMLWARGRLALPGAVATWLGSHSYVYVVAAWLGAVATAELNAARLLLMPTALIVVAWSRVARPRVSRLMADADRQALMRVLLASLFVLLLLILLYVTAIWGALPWLLSHLLGTDYASVSTLLGLWVLYFALSAVRWIGSVFLLCADDYRSMLTSSLASLGALAVALPLGLHFLGTAGAVLALVAVEGVQALLVWGVGVRAALRRLFTPAPLTA
ncbi:lipopolysaccharide biosynthesis protein [Verticiella alkaliphila]|uniref:lipopolysaccharide biosynthesis protein n=1 Tax=Verticiella alkaliphila TaxID=2779529 RepID=UPI001C0DE670|nr:hypothetical protein [Verticiella sp. GG226]